MNAWGLKELLFELIPLPKSQGLPYSTLRVRSRDRKMGFESQVSLK